MMSFLDGVGGLLWWCSLGGHTVFLQGFIVFTTFFFERAVILLLRLTFLLSQSSELLHGRNHFGFSSP